MRLRIFYEVAFVICIWLLLYPQAVSTEEGNGVTNPGGGGVATKPGKGGVRASGGRSAEPRQGPEEPEESNEEPVEDGPTEPEGPDDGPTEPEESNEEPVEDGPTEPEGPDDGPTEPEESNEEPVEDGPTESEGPDDDDPTESYGSGEGSGEGSGGGTDEDPTEPIVTNGTKKPPHGINLKCKDGLVLNVWQPQEDLTSMEVYIRGSIYFLAMSYLFIGVSIVADRFMSSIEVITSSERQVAVTNKSGERKVVPVRIWNETVANLTLMALGSSAPEILLSVVEIFQKNFEAGELGPGTIVGSAAYNLFVIIAVCVVVIPKGQVRRVRHLRVFIVTAAWSLFAYLWLYSVLVVITPGRVDIWEALLTFSFFPVTVLHAYVAERRMLCYKYLSKNYRTNNRGMVVSSVEDAEANTEATDEASAGGRARQQPRVRSSIKELAETSDMRDFEEARREYITILKELYRKYPQYELEQLEAMAQEHLIRDAPKSRAYYRIQATRKMVGSGNLTRRVQDRAVIDIGEVKSKMYSTDINTEEDDTVVRIFFEPGHYTVMESCGEFTVTVVRRGDLSITTTVAYYTEDGSAKAGSDYIAKAGVLSFAPGIDEQHFNIEVIDDDVFEQDEHFYIHLSNPSHPTVLAVPKVATIMILDDDHCGIFGFDADSITISETVGTYKLKVRRFSGAKSTIVVRYRTEENTAHEGKDFVATTGELVFKSGDVEKFIQLQILDEHSYEKNVMFYVSLEEPFIASDDPYLSVIQAAESKPPQNRTVLEQITLQGLPKLSEMGRAEVHITESEEFKLTVDKLVRSANASLLIGTSSWKEQFMEALTVAGGDEQMGDDDEDEIEEGDDGDIEDEAPGAIDYVMHFLTVFWKLVFAVVPPTNLWDGYVCFVVSILAIAAVTAVLADVASHFGCTMGVMDTVTAIAFVAIGTSVPDTFASVVSAQHDKTADNSVGNITGSNAVNVFLGVGIAWTMATVYHACKGDIFIMEVGTLGFSVALFLTEASIAIGLLLYRRNQPIGGELGGPDRQKWMHGMFLVGLWIFYVIVSTLEAYGFIRGF